MPHDTAQIILSKYFIKVGTVVKTPGRRIPSDSHYTNTFNIIRDDLIDMGITVKSSDFRKYVKDTLEENEEDKEEYHFKYDTCDDPEEFVLNFLEENGFQFGYEENNPGKKILKSSDSVNDPQGLEKMLMKYRVQYNYDSKQWSEKQGKKVIVREIHAAQELKHILEGIEPEIDAKRRPAVRECLKFNPDKAKGAEKLIRIALKAFDAYSVLNMAILIRWLWGVKRYLFQLTVEDPLFLNFYAKQGTGKTTFIRALMHSLGEYIYEGKLGDINKEGHANIFSSKYILFFDELRLDSEDKKQAYVILATLKYIITMRTNTRRLFHTQKMQEDARIFSAISTSNKPLINTIYDDTGMRRFVEIECKVEAGDKKYLKIPFIESSDPEVKRKAENVFKNMWRGIDENREDGYMTPELQKQLEALQGTYKKINCIEMFEIYSDSEDEIGYIKQDQKKSIDNLTELVEKHQDLKKLAFEDAFRDEGIELKTVLDYKKELQQWKDSDNADLNIYGITRMPGELVNYGYHVIVHKHIPYLAMPSNFASSQIGSRKKKKKEDNEES